MRELAFILKTLGDLVTGLFLLRALLQVVRTDFRNPLAQAIVKLSNPIVRPLRRALPAVGRLDTASLLAAFVAEALKQALLSWLIIDSAPAPARLLAISTVGLMNAVLSLSLVATFGYVLLSWVSGGGYNPAERLIADLLNPVLNRLQRLIPVIGGIDLSPMAMILGLYVLQMVLADRIGPWLLALT